MSAALPGSGDDVRAPSGQQIELVSGEQSATVVEVGGALRSYHIGNQPLVDGYHQFERCSGARGQTFVPWPNRLRDGTYPYGGQNHQLALSEPAKHNAIHGLVRWSNWNLEEHTADKAVWTYTLYPQAGWPFILDLSIEYQLCNDGLTVRTTAANAGTQPCPYGTGAHPYLTTGAAKIDECSLLAPGARWITTDDQAIPNGTKAVEGTPYDFRQLRTIGSTVLDTGFFDLERDNQGLAHVELQDQTSSRVVRLWMDSTYQYLMLFSGDSLASVDQRRRGLGVEPMTCAPNALQSGEGLRLLDPGESFVSSWGITPMPAESRN